MHRLLLLLGLSLALFCVAAATRLLLVPDVVAVAYAEGPQPIWQLETALLLQSIENVALLGAGLLLVLIVGGVVWPIIQRRRGGKPAE